MCAQWLNFGSIEILFSFFFLCGFFRKVRLFCTPPSYSVVFFQRDAKLKRIRRFWVGGRRFLFLYFRLSSVKIRMLVFCITFSLSFRLAFHCVSFLHLFRYLSFVVSLTRALVYQFSIFIYFSSHTVSFSFFHTSFFTFNFLFI